MTIGLCDKHGGFQGEACPTCGAKGDPVLFRERRVKLSKLLSGALRHFPDELGLEPDGAGWVPFPHVVEAAGRRYKWATEGAVRAVVDTDAKGRFELEGGKLRAAYGHSIEIALGDQVSPGQVPDVLYHATAPGNVAEIRMHGIKPMDRNEVHLSETPEAALEVGHRHDEDPVLLEVDVERLETMGYTVHRRSPVVFTVERVPPDCLAVRP